MTKSEKVEQWRRGRGQGKYASRIMANARQVAGHLLSHPCVDCGETDPSLLEFDHVRGEKSFEICSGTLSRSPKARQEEIEKCEVRCYRCHRINGSAVSDAAELLEMGSGTLVPNYIDLVRWADRPETIPC